MFLRAIPFLLALAACTDGKTDDVDPDPVDTDEAVEPELIVSNFTDNECPEGSVSSVSPLDEEDGQWAAARLQPTQMPWRADRINYTMLGMQPINDGDTSCKLLQHDVQVFVGGLTPPDTPTDVGLVTSGLTEDAPSATYSVDFDPPIVLEEGEYLWVMVQMVIDEEGDRTCIADCVEDGIPSANQWASTTAPPYSWATLASYGIDVNLAVAAEGEPVDSAD